MHASDEILFEYCRNEAYVSTATFNEEIAQKYIYAKVIFSICRNSPSTYFKLSEEI